MKLKLLAAALVLASGALHAQNVEVRDAWARATVQGQKGTGAFMSLTAKDATQLVGVSSPVAGVAEVHEMKMEGDVMKMRALPLLDLPAGKKVDLKPGGYHIMLMDLKAPLAKDSTVPVTLLFKDAKGVESKLELKRAGGPPPAPGAACQMRLSASRLSTTHCTGAGWCLSALARAQPAVHRGPADAQGLGRLQHIAPRIVDRLADQRGLQLPARAGSVSLRAAIAAAQPAGCFGPAAAAARAGADRSTAALPRMPPCRGVLPAAASNSISNGMAKRSLQCKGAPARLAVLPELRNHLPRGRVGASDAAVGIHTHQPVAVVAQCAARPVQADEEGVRLLQHEGVLNAACRLGHQVFEFGRSAASMPVRSSMPTQRPSGPNSGAPAQL
jgi:copper(I)-binding protein